MSALADPYVAPRPVPVALFERPEIAGWRDVFRAAPPELAAEHGIRWVQAGSAVAFAVASQPRSRLLNGVIGLGVDRPATPAQVELIGAFNEAAGVDDAVAVAPSARPLSLRAGLRAGGMREELPFVKFARIPHPRASHPTDLPIRMAGPADAGAIGALVADAYDLPESLGPWFAALVGRPRWRWVVACDGGTAVAAGGLFVDDEGAWAAFGATRPSHRGRGAHGALLAARVRMAASEGVGTIVTEADAPVGVHPGTPYRNIARAGFVEAYSRAHLRRARIAGDAPLPSSVDR